MNEEIFEIAGTIEVYNRLNIPVLTKDKTEAHHVNYYTGEDKDYRNGKTSNFHRLQHLAIHAWLILYGNDHFPKNKQVPRNQIIQVFTELEAMVNFQSGKVYIHPMLEKNKPGKPYRYRFTDNDFINKAVEANIMSPILFMLEVAKKYQGGWMVDYSAISMEDIKGG